MTIDPSPARQHGWRDDEYGAPRVVVTGRWWPDREVVLVLDCAACDETQTRARWLSATQLILEYPPQARVLHRESRARGVEILHRPAASPHP